MQRIGIVILLAAFFFMPIFIAISFEIGLQASLENGLKPPIF